MPKCPRWRRRILTFSDWMTSSAVRCSEIPSLLDDTKSSMPFFFSCKKRRQSPIHRLVSTNMCKVWLLHSAGLCARVSQGRPVLPRRLPETTEEDWRLASSRLEPRTGERRRETGWRLKSHVYGVEESYSLLITHTHLISFFISSVKFLPTLQSVYKKIEAHRGAMGVETVKYQIYHHRQWTHCFCPCSIFVVSLHILQFDSADYWAFLSFLKKIQS